MDKRLSPARPQLIRAMNEQVMLDHIRRSGPVAQADLVRMSGLSKPTVRLAVANLERAGLIRAAGRRTGGRGPAAALHEVRPEAGYVLGLDVGRQFIRGAIVDVNAHDLARDSVSVKAANGLSLAGEVIALADALLAAARLKRTQLTQTVIGSPGIYDLRRDALRLAGGLPGWESPTVLARLRSAFGDDVMIENDVDVAAYAEHAHGHGRDVDNFAFISVGTGIGMGLILGGELHRGVHGAAGEIGFLPFSGGGGGDAADARKRGHLEATASAAAVVRAAKRAKIRGATSARKVFEAAAAGDERAGAIVADEAALVAKAVCTVVTVIDPELVVLGGGIGQAPGLVDVVVRELRALVPVRTPVKVSALGANAVVDGCLAVGLVRAWDVLTAAITPAAESGPGSAQPAS
jgi:predicted NBD/HSP70 family sugar kinase